MTDVMTRILNALKKEEEKLKILKANEESFKYIKINVSIDMRIIKGQIEEQRKQYNKIQNKIKAAQDDLTGIVICYIDEYMYSLLYLKKRKKISDNTDPYNGDYSLNKAVCTMESDLPTYYFDNDSDEVDKTYQNAVDLAVAKSTVPRTEIERYIDTDKAKNEAAIRRDWKKAFEGVKRGDDLAGNINYRFTKEDLIEFGELHKRNKFRRKIEDILECCNYHNECGLLAANNYDDYEKIIAACFK